MVKLQTKMRCSFSFGAGARKPSVFYVRLILSIRVRISEVSHRNIRRQKSHAGGLLWNLIFSNRRNFLKLRFRFWLSIVVMTSTRNRWLEVDRSIKGDRSTTDDAVPPFSLTTTMFSSSCAVSAHHKMDQTCPSPV